MLKCPECDANLKQDFGMVTCNKCKAVLMIDITGQVQTGSSTPFEQDDDEELYGDGAYDDEATQFEASQTIDPATEAADYFASNDDDNTSLGQLGDSMEASADGDFEEMEDPEDSNDDYEDSDYEENAFEETVQALDDEDLIEEVEEPDAPMIAASTDVEDFNEEVETFPMATEPDPKPVDITDYANSEESSLEDGELLYDLFIGRLDSKDLREGLKLVLLDDKLKINHHEYMKKIKNGEVLIPDLNPIKTKRIVEQLQYLDLDIKWKQKRVIMETVEPEVEDEEGMVEDAEI